jgi:glutathione synthase/RimK-type ligase-like ATP-grasp enzyme
MQEAGVPVPATYTAPNQISNDDCDSGIVIRPGRHAQGRNLYVTYGYDRLVTKLRELNYGDGNYYLSALIEKVAEYRVFVCQNRVAWVANKTPGNPDDVAWNVTQGGRFDSVRWGMWPMRVVEAALHAARVSGTDFSGVDVMVDAEGRPYVLEVNSAPSQTSEYRQRCVAECFDYIVENGKQHFDTPSIISNWKDVIHPAVRGMSDER